QVTSAGSVVGPGGVLGGTVSCGGSTGGSLGNSSGSAGSCVLVDPQGLMDSSLDTICGISFPSQPTAHSPHTISPPPTTPPTMSHHHHSNLDPNARVYTPKGTNTVTSEA
ncbi:unnamed protein product, partial [Meganyctiphanes norvegica]